MNLSFLVSRTLQAVLVLFVVSVLAFMLAHSVGDPVASILGFDATPAARAALRTRMHLDAPLPKQYLFDVSNMLHGNFGVSYTAQRPVMDMFAERIPATLELAGAALLLSLAIGIPIGVLCAVHRHRKWPHAVMTSTVVGVSIPTFVLGIGMIFLFSVGLGWLPSFGRGEVVHLGFWSTGLLSSSGIESLIMPAIALALGQIALVARLVRTEMIGILKTDFIRFARARGVPAGRLYARHALRNALIPIITVSGIQMGYLVAFAVVVEQVYQWPGMGTLFLQALSQTDVPVICAFLVFVAIFFVVVNLLVDFLYALTDPRLRVAGRATSH